MAQRKVKKMKYDPEEETRLERQVFGDAKDVIENLLKRDSDKIKAEDFEITVSSDDENTDELGVDDDDDKNDDNNSENESSEEDNNSEEVEGKIDSEDENVVDSDSDSTNDEQSDEVESVGDTEDIEDAWKDDADDKYTVGKALTIQKRKLPVRRPEKTYKQLLENKFQQLVGTPKWAKIDDKNEEKDDDSEDEVLRHCNHLSSVKYNNLLDKIIDIKVLKDVNVNTRNEGPTVTSVQFHPTSTVALVAGLSGVLSICQVDGKENTKLQSIKFNNFRINTAKFLKEGTEVLCGSRTKMYSQTYDLITGKTCKIPLPHTMSNMQDFDVSPDGKTIAVIGRKWGEIFLLTSSGKELIHTFKMHKKCRALAFTPDNKYLITHGESEEVYIWDLHDRRCFHRAVDDGCISGLSVAISPSGQFLATGSKQGVVNIYELKTVLNNQCPKPSKIIMNLVTPITALKFNPTSEILAMSSNLKENAFRMVHFPSLNVFSNFPSFGTVMDLPLAIDFSPGSGFMSVTNNKNKAFLYRLKHYGNY